MKKTAFALSLALLFSSHAFAKSVMMCSTTMDRKKVSLQIEQVGRSEVDADDKSKKMNFKVTIRSKTGKKIRSYPDSFGSLKKDGDIHIDFCQDRRCFDSFHAQLLKGGAVKNPELMRTFETVEDKGPRTACKIVSAN